MSIAQVFLILEKNDAHFFVQVFNIHSKLNTKMNHFTLLTKSNLKHSFFIICKFI